MYEFLNHGLHSPNAFVRKGSALLLGAQKRLLRGRAYANSLTLRPPVLANSFPKSGTHLLDQIAAALPDRVNYGAFLSSMTSSFQYRLRTRESTLRYIRHTVPGELVRAHLYWASEYDDALEALNVVHYFIYRDLRDVAVSTSHYLRRMNRWHRLSRMVRALPDDEASLRLFIIGVDGGGPDSLLPNIAERFRSYEGWIASPHVMAVKYEDLVGPQRDERLLAMATFYADRSSTPVDVAATAERLRVAIAPEKSHTFRQGKRGGWQEAFTPELKQEFKRVAGDLLIRLGYVTDQAW
jgi:sulfotransferase 6B1